LLTNTSPHPVSTKYAKGKFSHPGTKAAVKVKHHFSLALNSSKLNYKGLKKNIMV
jgi:hypothetical protein